MPEFYKYAERQAGSQINWAGLGVDMSETLNKEEQIREQKRGAIDDATNKMVETLATAPKGEAQDGNKFVSDYSDNATQSLLIQHRLLKAGRLSPKDYMLFNANMKSGTTQLFNLQTEYQKQYAEKMARLKSNDPKTRSQNLEADYMAFIEAFGDLSKSKALINPATGQVNVGLMEYDKDNVLQPTSKVMSVQDVYKGIAQKFDYFDVMDASKNISDNLADVVMTTLKEGSLNKQGQLITLDYALQEPNTQKALDNYVDGFLENPYNVSSILTNDLHTYQNEFSEDGTKKSSGNKIVWKVDKFGSPSTEFTKEQKQAAKDYLLTQTKAQIAKKEEIKNFQSAQVDAERLKLQQRESSRQDSELRLRKTQTDNGEVDIYTPFSKWIDKQFSATIRKADGTADYENKPQTVRQLNKAYSGLGYEFVIDVANPNYVEIVKGGTDTEGKEKRINVGSIPLAKGARGSIKKLIIEDLSGSTNGVDRIKALYQSGAFDEFNTPTQQTTAKKQSSPSNSVPNTANY